MPWTNGSFDYTTGANVGSSNSQDLFCGYGTEFENTDRFIIDISDVIHMLGADQTKLISWMQAGGTDPTSAIDFSHMEDELFTVRDFKAKLKRYADGTDFVWLLEMYSPQDWQAIETMPLGDSFTTGGDVDKPGIFMTITDGTEDFSCTINKWALNGTGMRTIPAHDGAATNAPGAKKDVIVIASGTASAVTMGGATAVVGSGKQEVSAVPSGVGAGAFDQTYWDNSASFDVTVHVTTPEEYLGGMAQGSGLPNETRKKGRSIKNYVQIFKTPWSISNTMKQVAVRGGDSLALMRLRKMIQHKTEIEYAMMFQGGGVEGTDYGILSTSTENPKTRFKGLGVGLSVTGLTTKPGFIYSKNCDLNSDFTLSRGSATPASVHALLARVFDDLVDNPSETKICLCSNAWLIALADLAASSTTNGFFKFGDHTVPNALGIPNVRELISPVGNLRMVPFKHLRGRFENYAVVLDMKNIKYRPFRPTKMLSNVGTDEIDGQLDYAITEAGIQVFHESTHAVMKLVS